MFEVCVWIHMISQSPNTLQAATRIWHLLANSQLAVSLNTIV